MDTGTLWNNIILPILIGPVCLIIKELYDRWDFKKKESVILSNKLKLEKINNKLQLFYWPLYILLLKDFDLWSKIVFKENDEVNITHTDSDTGVEDDGETYHYCNYVKKIKDRVVPCRNPVAINCIDRFGPYCIKHQCFKYKKILKVYKMCYDNGTLFKEKTDEILDTRFIDIEKGEIKQREVADKFQHMIHKKMDSEKNDFESDTSSSSMRSIIDHEEIGGNITGNAVGDISGLNSYNSHHMDLNSSMMREIIKNIRENQTKITDIIINNMSIAEPTTHIGKQLMKYIKFVNIFQSEVNGDFIDPSKFGAPYPKKLLPMVEIGLFKLQKKYNKVVEDFYDF